MCDYYHSFLYNPVFGRFVICFWHISLWFHTLMHMGLTFLQNLISKADFVYSIWIIYCPLFISLIHNLPLTLCFPNWQCKELSPGTGTSNFCWERKVKAFQLLKHPVGFPSSALPLGSVWTSLTVIVWLGTVVFPAWSLRCPPEKKPADSQGAKWGETRSREVKGRPTFVFQFVSNTYFFRAKGPAVPH